MSFLTLADVKPRLVDVIVKYGSEQQLVIPMRVPSYIEWQEIGLAVPHPEPGKKAVFHTGKKTYEADTGPAYQMQVINANNERALRRLAFALVNAGNFPEIKDKSLLEQAQAIGTMDAGLLEALMRSLNQVVQLTAGTVKDRAAAFRPADLSTNGHGDLQPPQLDADNLGDDDILGERILDSLGDAPPAEVDRLHKEDD